MGGVDKGLQPFQGVAMVDQVIRRLAPQVASVTINANRSLPQYQAIISAAGYGDAVVPDQLTGYEGPLAGLQTGLQHCRTELLLTAPCDSPCLPADLAARLYAAMQAEDADAAIAVTLESGAGSSAPQRQPHPVFSLLKASLLPQLDTYLATGARRMEGWFKTLRVAEVVFDDANAFRNINTPGELQALQHNAPATAQTPCTEPSAAGSESALPVAEAQRLILDCIEPVDSSETLFLRSLLGRVLARDVISPINVPAHDNSAMDGYAPARRGSTAARRSAPHLQGRRHLLCGPPEQRAGRTGRLYPHHDRRHHAARLRHRAAAGAGGRHR